MGQHVDQEHQTTAQWHLSYAANEGIIRSTVTGRVTIHAALKMVSEALLRAAEVGADRFFVDYSGAAISVSTIEIYDLPMKLMALGAGHSIKVAVLPPRDAKAADDFRFFEARMANNALQLRLFSQMEEAISWLNGGRASATSAPRATPEGLTAP
jgi:hypothetical protein